jgi:phage tail-like protein
VTRGTVPGLPSAHPLALLLPGVFAEDPFVERFVAGLDDVLAPTFLTLDCLDAYLDPWLTPRDFLPWLASWVGVEVDETWPPARARAVVANAVRVQRGRGTPRGLAAHLRLLTGGEVEISESGGARWSTQPGAEPPGRPSPGVSIVVRVADPAVLDRAAVERAVREACPAHLPVELQVLASERRPRT